MVSREQVLSATESSGTPEPEPIDRIIEAMAQRELQLFPEDRRLIVDAESCEESDGSFYLIAVFAQA